MNIARHRRWVVGMGVAAGVAVLFWLVPPFHIVSLRASRQREADAAFNASTYVEKLWREQLGPAAKGATGAATLLEEAQKDAVAARKKYGRTLGMANNCIYFLAGEGRVVKADKNGVTLLIGGTPGVELVLETGNIFGNAVRDGTGLVDVSQFANSRDFNAISAEINRRIEERVLPGLREKAVIGATVRFAGCAEVMDEATDMHPLHVVPLTAEVQ